MLSSCYVSCLLIHAGGEERADARLFDKIVMVIPVLFRVIIIYDYMCERSKKNDSPLSLQPTLEPTATATIIKQVNHWLATSSIFCNRLCACPNQRPDMPLSSNEHDDNLHSSSLR